MSLKTFIFIGPSGCGKGTQAKLIIDYLKKNDSAPVYYLESGENFRNFIKGDSYSSKLSAEIYKKDILQPEFLAVWIWSHLLIENLKGDEHLVLDGTPRKLDEAQVLDSAMKFYDRKEVYCVFLNVSRNWSKERLLARGRMDDGKTDIEKRLDWYETDVVPAINFFRDNPKYKFVEVNGEQTIEKVHEDIVKAVFN
ncbi:nucleoside monophosphate kinase [Candidatus Nomurabacteria bacterium]|nr:nucleoside monophosphate kinase [Candidatus Nomurabacteria bacterium]